jgi:hypothetical protein
VEWSSLGRADVEMLLESRLESGGVGFSFRLLLWQLDEGKGERDSKALGLPCQTIELILLGSAGRTSSQEFLLVGNCP